MAYLSLAVTLPDPHFLKAGDVGGGISRAHAQRPHLFVHRDYDIALLFRGSLLGSSSSSSLPWFRWCWLSRHGAVPVQCEMARWLVCCCLNKGHRRMYGKGFQNKLEPGIRQGTPRQRPQVIASTLHRPPHYRREHRKRRCVITLS